MGYTAPKVWSNEALIASDMNTYISDNLAALKDPPSAVYNADESADYNTTSSTFTNVDTTDTEGLFRHTITTTGGDVMVHFHGNVRNGTGITSLDITVDGVLQGGGNGIIAVPPLAVPGYPVSFTRLITGLSAGSHTFRLQWKSSAAGSFIYAGAGTANADSIPQFWVREVS